MSGSASIFKLRISSCCTPQAGLVWASDAPVFGFTDATSTPLKKYFTVTETSKGGPERFQTVMPKFCFSGGAVSIATTQVGNYLLIVVITHIVFTRS